MSVELTFLGEGKRTKIYGIGSKDYSRIVRVPHNPSDDIQERKDLNLLKQFFEEKGHLPNPRAEEFIIDGKSRFLVTCDNINSFNIKKIPSEKSFQHHLDFKLTTLDDKLGFLSSLKSFVEQSKEMYWSTKTLPDLIGKGNMIPYGNNVLLLDFNNHHFESEKIKGTDIHVPVDEFGWPIFDMSLRLLYNIEKSLLTYSGSSFSSPKFNAFCYKDNSLNQEDIKSKRIFTSREELKEDPIYGALRFKDRREKVENIICNQVKLKKHH